MCSLSLYVYFHFVTGKLKKIRKSVKIIISIYKRRDIEGYYSTVK